MILKSPSRDCILVHHCLKPLAMFSAFKHITLFCLFPNCFLFFLGHVIFACEHFWPLFNYYSQNVLTMPFILFVLCWWSLSYPDWNPIRHCRWLPRTRWVIYQVVFFLEIVLLGLFFNNFFHHYLLSGVPLLVSFDLFFQVAYLRGRLQQLLFYWPHQHHHSFRIWKRMFGGFMFDAVDF